MNFTTTTICIDKAKPYRELYFKYDGDKLLALFNIVPMGGRHWEALIKDISIEEKILNLIPHLYNPIDEEIIIKPCSFVSKSDVLEKIISDAILHFISQYKCLILNYLKQQ